MLQWGGRLVEFSNYTSNMPPRWAERKKEGRGQIHAQTLFVSWSDTNNMLYRNEHALLTSSKSIRAENSWKNGFTYRCANDIDGLTEHVAVTPTMIEMIGSHVPQSKLQITSLKSRPKAILPIHTSLQKTEQKILTGHLRRCCPPASVRYTLVATLPHRVELWHFQFHAFRSPIEFAHCKHRATDPTFCSNKVPWRHHLPRNSFR